MKHRCFSKTFVFTCSRLQNGSQSLPEHTWTHLIQRLKIIAPEYTECFPRDQIVIGSTSKVCLFWICLTQRPLPAPINERQEIDHHKPSCLISVQIFIITREDCLPGTVHAIVWMSHGGGKGLATEGTRTKLMGTILIPCVVHLTPLRVCTNISSCVHVYVKFFCVCLKCLIVLPSWRTNGFCGVEHLNVFAQNLRPNEVGRSRHHLSLKAFKPRRCSKARGSDASVQADLNYESVYLFCYFSFVFVLFLVFLLRLLSHWQLLFITLTLSRMLSQDHKQSERCRKYYMVIKGGLSDIRTPDWPLPY